jgi:hypothetical protein
MLSLIVPFHVLSAANNGAAVMSIDAAMRVTYFFMNPPKRRTDGVTTLHCSAGARRVRGGGRAEETGERLIAVCRQGAL